MKDLESTTETETESAFIKSENSRKFCARGRIFNNMLYVRNVHLAESQAYSQETNQSSRQRVYYITTISARIQLERRKSLVVSLKGPGAETY
jgi:Sec7-like guanine-nucleotide exchange factor